MADALAGALNIADFAIKTVKAIKEIVEAVKNAPEEVDTFRIYVDTLTRRLTALERELQRREQHYCPPPEQDTYRDLGAILQSCLRDLEIMQRSVEEIERAKTTAESRRFLLFPRKGSKSDSNHAVALALAMYFKQDSRRQARLQKKLDALKICIMTIKVYV